MAHNRKFIQMQTMRSLLIFAFSITYCSSSLHAQSNYPEFRITDSVTYINNIRIPDSVTQSFFVEILGNPQRVKRKKGYVTNIYDKLGITLLYRKASGKMNSISFFYSNILREYPRDQFRGRIFVNGVLLEENGDPDEIANKLPGFKYESFLGLIIFDNRKTEFSISMLPGSNKWSAFGYRFFRPRSRVLALQ
jgi:hypothetical protein